MLIREVIGTVVIEDYIKNKQISAKDSLSNDKLVDNLSTKIQS